MVMRTMPAAASLTFCCGSWPMCRYLNLSNKQEESIASCRSEQEYLTHQLQQKSKRLEAVEEELRAYTKQHKKTLQELELAKEASDTAYARATAEVSMLITTSAMMQTMMDVDDHYDDKDGGYDDYDYDCGEHNDNMNIVLMNIMITL